MNKTIKSICVVMVIMTVLVYTLNCFAYIECDGRVNNYEWDGVEKTVLFTSSDHTGCEYSTAAARVKFSEVDRRVYLAVLFSDSKTNVDENGVCSLTVSFNDSSPIILYSDLTSEYDEDLFFAEHGFLADSFGGGSFEAEFVLKETDYSDTLTMYLTVTDYSGNSSQVYDFLIKSEEKKEEESESVARSEKESSREAEKAKRTTKTRTTKVKTTKPKTSKTEKEETTTEILTVMITEDIETLRETYDKNSLTVLIIGIASVVTSVIAVGVMIKRKEK